MSNADKANKAHEKTKPVYETTEVITSNVYKVSPEEKEKLDRMAEEKLNQAREYAIPKIRALYEQRVGERRQPKADGEEA